MIVSIRTAVDDDMPVLSEIYRRASLSNDADREYLLAHPEVLVLSDRGVREGRTRVAIHPDTSVLGFASWLVSGGVIELEDLFVDPSWMRRGVGRALVLDAVEIASGQRFDRLEVTANPHAQRFYESVGFTADHVVATAFHAGFRMHLDVP